MKEAVKILMLEDNINDAELIQRFLAKNKLNSEFKLATDKKTYLQALDQFQPMIILADHSLPDFNSKDAFIIARKKFLEIPFIMVTGSVSEEFAADMIKMGVDDYILKDRIARLPTAIITALQRRETEKEKREAEQRIIQSETNLRTIFENTSEGFLLMDKHAIILAFNNRAKKYVLFSDVNEFQIGQSTYNFIEGPRKEIFEGIIKKALEGESTQYDRSFEMENGNIGWIDFSVTPVIESGEVKGVCITGRDITEKKFMEQKILAQEIQHQKKVTRAIIQAQEKERNFIGQELHDNINQILASAKMYLEMEGNKNEEIKESVRYPMELINSSVEEIRLLCRDLVTPRINIDIEELVQALIDKFEENTTIKTNLYFSISEKILPDDLKLNLYRIVQEQLNNIAKHAAAKNVRISIQTDSNIINLIVEDDGKGFDVNKKRKGIGISNMINRIESFNGEVTIETAPGKGCRIIIKVPY